MIRIRSVAQQTGIHRAHPRSALPFKTAVFTSKGLHPAQQRFHERLPRRRMNCWPQAQKTTEVDKIQPFAVTEGCQVGTQLSFRHVRLERHQGINGETGVIQVAASIPPLESAVRRLLAAHEALHSTSRLSQDTRRQSRDLKHFQTQ